MKIDKELLGRYSSYKSLKEEMTTVYRYRWSVQRYGKKTWHESTAQLSEILFLATEGWSSDVEIIESV